MYKYVKNFSIFSLGPTSQKKEQLEQLIDAGMTIARLNFSHGTHEVPL